MSRSAGRFGFPEQSGATLVEVGTTNRTSLKDYERALNDHSALIAKIHPSNYLISGFTQSVGARELASLAHGRGLPLYFDQGTGLMIKTDELLSEEAAGSWDELSVGEILDQGCDLVSFSGDKLLGGPQSGIIVGKKQYIDRLKSHPLARALRLDKLSLAALAATLRLYLRRESALEQIPSLSMLTQRAEDLNPIANSLKAQINEQIFARIGEAVANVEVSLQVARVGGGTLPGLELPSPAVCISPLKGSVDGLASWLAKSGDDTAIIARVQDGQLILDVRTLCGDFELEMIAKRVAEYFLTLNR